jgi:mono/diheme cytochrome c family protein
MRNSSAPAGGSSPSAAVLFLSFLVGFCGLIPFASAQQQPAPKKIWDGVFTAEQALRGKAEYDQTCSRCHNLALIGSERGPSIKGPAFQEQYEKGSLADLFIFIRDTMPEGGPGTLNDDTKVDILTYILQQNGYPTGPAELKKDLGPLSDIRMAKKGIWDGVFTAAQASRGKAALSQNGCNGCHGAELAGDRGPSLIGDRFLKAWENGSVNKLFSKIKDTMPPLNAEQVSPATKADIVAYLLEVNGFPAGSSDLPADTAALDSVQIIRKEALAAGAANFTLVQLVGCLEPAANGRWQLTRASEPANTKEDKSTPAALKTAASTALGTGKFDLVSVSLSYQVETHRGHKMEARGLLYRDTNYAEINLTSLSMAASTCNN